jgi:streptogrisin C
MKRQRALAVTAACAIATATALVAGSAPASADPLELKAREARADLLGYVAPELVQEMSETFDLSASEVYDRLAVEAVASDLLEQVPAEFEDTYAGLWVSDDGDEILVATTSRTDADDLAAEGATPVMAQYSMDELEAAVAALDAVDADVHGYYIDVESNDIVIEAPDEAAAADLATAAGVDPDMIRVGISSEAPQTYAVRGGDAYGINNGYGCSVGFAVTRGSTKGFVTAGHCGRTGAGVISGSAAPGTFRASVFPDSDRAWVEVGSNQTLQNVVNMYSGSRYVYNSDVAAVGSSVCRSGRTTGWHCGTIQAFNQTVRYEAGPVYEMTRTSVCAEPGDSGGAYITGNSAQGITSGGSGNCRTGGTTFFQPVNEALSAWGLTLYTGDSAPPGGDAIVARHSGKCLDIASASTANGATVQQYDCWSGTNQQFELRDAGSGYVQIVARHSGKCLDVASASTANGATVQQYDCWSGTNQQFQLRDAGSGYVQIVARHSGKCLDVTSASTANGALVKQYDCHGGTNQQWSL